MLKPTLIRRYRRRQLRFQPMQDFITECVRSWLKRQERSALNFARHTLARASAPSSCKAVIAMHGRCVGLIESLDVFGPILAECYGILTERHVRWKEVNVWKGCWNLDIDFLIRSVTIRIKSTASTHRKWNALLKEKRTRSMSLAAK